MNSKQQILLNKIEYLFKFFYILGIVVVLALLDETGKDYIISSFMVFMLIYLFCGLSIPQAFGNAVRVRFQKQQFHNARTVFKGTVLYTLLLETMAMVLAYCFSGRMTAFLNNVKNFPYGIRLFLPLLLLLPIIEIFRTYYLGYNRRITVIISRCVGTITAFITGVCVYAPLKEYGKKADALLKSSCLENMYASLTIPIAILASQVMVLLYLCWMYLVYKPYIRKQITNDLTKYTESISRTVPMMAKEHFKANLHKFSIYILVFAAFIFCSFYNRKAPDLSNANTSFGILAIVLCVTVLVPYFVSKAFSLKYIIRFRKLLRSEDMRNVKAYLWNRTHKFIMITFALSIFFVIMSKSVIFILTGSTLNEYVTHMMILSVSFALVPLYCLYSMFLIQMGKSAGVLIINYVALLLSVGMMLLLYNVPAIGGYGISIGIVAYFLIAYACEFVILEKESGFNKNIMQLLILPGLSALLMGIILFLITKAIGIVEYRILQFLIVFGLLAVCTFLYIILLLVLHSIDEEEINGGFWGKIVYKIGEMLHLF